MDPRLREDDEGDTDPTRYAKSAVVHPDPLPTSKTLSPGLTSSLASINLTVAGWELVWPIFSLYDLECFIEPIE